MPSLKFLPFSNPDLQEGTIWSPESPEEPQKAQPLLCQNPRNLEIYACENSVSLGTDPPSKIQPNNFFCPSRH